MASLTLRFRRYRQRADEAWNRFEPQPLDLGFNAHSETPSLLQRNAETLGLALDAVDAVVISHQCLDHMGGLKAQRSR